MKQKILGAITIGQAPRVDITKDILPLLPEHVLLREYGALDDFTYEEIMTRFARRLPEIRYWFPVCGMVGRWNLLNVS